MAEDHSVELVDSYAQVAANVLQFNEDLGAHEEIVAQLSVLHNWYYIPCLDRFGPSEYIGYKEMNFFRYNRGHRTAAQKVREEPAMDGERTTQVLSRWFEPSDSGILYNKLSQLFDEYDKKINKSATIFLPRRNPTTEQEKHM